MIFLKYLFIFFMAVLLIRMIKTLLFSPGKSKEVPSQSKPKTFKQDIKWDAETVEFEEIKKEDSK